jgi:hypothetical protein
MSIVQRQHLNPIITVSDLEFAASASGEASCKEVVDSAVQPTLQILQSGTHLILDLNVAQEMRLKGQLEELTIVTDQSETAVLQASVDRQSEPDRLAGTLTLPTCGKSVSFTGTRSPNTVKDSGGH